MYVLTAAKKEKGIEEKTQVIQIKRILQRYQERWEYFKNSIKESAKKGWPKSVVHLTLETSKKKAVCWIKEFEWETKVMKICKNILDKISKNAIWKVKSCSLEFWKVLGIQ